MNKRRNNLLIATQLCSIVLLTIFIAASAQAQTPAAARTDSRGDAKRMFAFAPKYWPSLAPAGFKLFRATGTSANAVARPNTNSLMPIAAGLNLQVPGSGTLFSLPRLTSINDTISFIGNSTIFESGLVWRGADSPTPKLTVARKIQSTSGGFELPNRTLQTSAASGPLFMVAHDTTLTGVGTAAETLGVAIPLNLMGTAGNSFVLNVENSSEGGSGIGVRAGDGSSGPGGDGVHAEGGSSNTGISGRGVTARGGSSSSGPGGDGVRAEGGSGTTVGGRGVTAHGGSSNGGAPGEGVSAFGGNNSLGNGGNGLVAQGGQGNGVGRRGGDGIFVNSGRGINGAADGYAGYFQGDVYVNGTLSKGGGSFKIDHPLDPENRYLYHSFVESPDMKNIYDGNITTDANGEAIVTLPAYFDALNRDFRYQLTVIGTFAQAIVSDEIQGNLFVIRTSSPNVKVSWQVTGIRRDAWANVNRIKVEEEKSENERGYYLHPKAFNQPEERSVEWAGKPELMQRMKESRAKQN